MKLAGVIFISIILLSTLSAQIKNIEQESSRMEIICPSHLEFEFTQRIYNDYSIERGGHPILCFKEAKIEGNKLIAVYEYEFATYEDFSFMCFAGNSFSTLPDFIELQLKYTDTFYKEWELMNPVKIDRSNKGWLIVTSIVDEDNLKNIETTGFMGATYSKTVQNNYQPKLFMEFDGVAKVNDDGTGFIIANSMVELNDNEGGVLVNPNKEILNKKNKKPEEKFNGKKTPKKRRNE
ncbi:MAG: hypothetical protein KKB34_02735 [Bacteroidetes bacterium]|nr:hypothetical protein [Bacteroidota bacterium]